MGERGMKIKSDVNKQGWETTDFPILCETCLGDNPYLRMTKEPFGKGCKICERPFTTFRWKPGQRARFKSTQICTTCAKMKNTCQCCVLDLQYGLPLQLRDAILQEDGGPAAATSLTTQPQSTTNRMYFAQQYDQLVAAGEDPYARAEPNQRLLRMARREPRYKRNLPNKCSFFAAGTCKRGDKCPFLHEMPLEADHPFAKQNTRDRYYGNNDPVAQAMLNRTRERNGTAAPTPPADTSVTTLWVGNLPSTGEVQEDDLRGIFEAHGTLSSVRVVATAGIAFVEFARREEADAAVSALHRNLRVRGHELHLNWARPKGEKAAREMVAPADPALNFSPYAPPPGVAPGQSLPPPPAGLGAAAAGSLGAPPPLGPGAGPMPYYPSMDPNRMGAAARPRPPGPPGAGPPPGPPPPGPPPGYGQGYVPGGPYPGYLPTAAMSAGGPPRGPPPSQPPSGPPPAQPPVAASAP